MKHQRQEKIKKTNDIIAISVITELVKKDMFPKAIETAQKRKFTPEQFGIIANMVDLSAAEIYKRVFVI